MNLLPSYLQEPAYQYKYQKLIAKKGYSGLSLWQPSPENAPQQLAYELALSGEVMQIGYGGQAGGGKSDLALGLGTCFPTAKIFRRSFTAMKKLIERGDQIYPVDYVSGEKKSWRWTGHNIELAHMQHEKHWKDHQGQAVSYVAFDEGAQFTETMVRSVGGWVRTSDKNQHTLLLICFNPPETAEGEWIVRFFAPWIDPDYPGERAKDGEIRWFVYDDKKKKDIEVPDDSPVTMEDGKVLHPISRTFIRASRHDNPYLGDDYERALSAMPEPLRTMVMEGDFTVGGKDDEWQVIPSLWILQAQERGRKSQRPELALRSVGVDPSRDGIDETIMAKLYGNWLELLQHPGGDGPTVGNFVISNMESVNNVPINIDAIGLGTSAYDYLCNLNNIRVNAIINSEGTKAITANGIYGFTNVRAESYWRLREALDPASGENICLPDDRMLRVELQAPRYKVRSGKITIEPKEDIKKRIGRSPDRADAVVMAWYGCVNQYDIVSFSGSLT